MSTKHTLLCVQLTSDALYSLLNTNPDFLRHPLEALFVVEVVLTLSLSRHVSCVVQQ